MCCLILRGSFYAMTESCYKSGIDHVNAVFFPSICQLWCSCQRDLRLIKYQHSERGVRLSSGNFDSGRCFFANLCLICIRLSFLIQASLPSKPPDTHDLISIWGLMCCCIRGTLPSKSNYSLPPSLSHTGTQYVWLKCKPEHTETCVSTQSNSGFMNKHNVTTANIYSTSYGVMPQSGAMSHWFPPLPLSLFGPVGCIVHLFSGSIFNPLPQAHPSD